MDKRELTSNGPLVSIIVLSMGDPQITLECLSAISEKTRYRPFEVLVVDNGSSAKHWSQLQRAVKALSQLEVKLIRNRENLGYARANNQAAQEAQGEFLLFLNNDVIVSKGWLTELVLFMRKHSRAAACQPKLRSQVEPDYFDYAGGSGGFVDLFGYPFTRGRVFDSIEEDFGQYDTQAQITWASGSCLLLRADAFRKLGGFDEYFFAYMEEIDLCVRLALEGYHIWAVPQVSLFHYGAYTSNRNLSQKIFRNHRNNLYFVLKHYSLWPTLPLILTRIAFDLGSMLHYASERKFSFIWSVVCAHLALIRDFPSHLRRGVVTLRGKNLSSLKTVYRGSIVIDYFFLGRERYSQIIGKKKDDGALKRYLDVTYVQRSD